VLAILPLRGCHLLAAPCPSNAKTNEKNAGVLIFSVAGFPCLSFSATCAVLLATPVSFRQRVSPRLPHAFRTDIT
jgi:hypothetical protein